MNQVNFHNLRIECVQGDIVRQGEVDAVVNAANAALMPGGGVAGAIHQAAGPSLAEECRPLAPIEPGQAVITSGHDLPNPYIIHCLGPVYGRDKPEEQLLGDCYRNALALAEEKRLRSIAFPALSTGAFGYPLEEATRVVFNTVREQAGALESVQLVRFVLRGSEDLTIYTRVMEEILRED